MERKQWITVGVVIALVCVAAGAIILSSNDDDNTLIVETSPDFAPFDYMLSGEGFTPFTEGYARGNLFAEAMDRWTVDSPSDDHFYPRLSIANTSNNYRSSTKWLYNGSFLRLSDLEFGYNFPKKLLTPLYINGLRLYFHANNLALFSPWKMWDPEIGKGRGDAYPLQRKFNFGIRVTF